MPCRGKSIRVRCDLVDRRIALSSVAAWEGGMAFTARIETKWWTLIAVSLVFLPLNIDFYGIVVALPTIGRELGASTTSLAWTVNAFILGTPGPLVAMGALGGIVLRRG